MRKLTTKQESILVAILAIRNCRHEQDEAFALLEIAELTTDPDIKAAAESYHQEVMTDAWGRHAERALGY